MDFLIWNCLQFFFYSLVPLKLTPDVRTNRPFRVNSMNMLNIQFPCKGLELNKWIFLANVYVELDPRIFIGNPKVSTKGSIFIIITLKIALIIISIDEAKIRKNFFWPLCSVFSKGVRVFVSDHHEMRLCCIIPVKFERNLWWSFRRIFKIPCKN